MVSVVIGVKVGSFADFGRWCCSVVGWIFGVLLGI